MLEIEISNLSMELLVRLYGKSILGVQNTETFPFGFAETKQSVQIISRCICWQSYEYWLPGISYVHKLIACYCVQAFNIEIGSRFI